MTGADGRARVPAWILLGGAALVGSPDRRAGPRERPARRAPRRWTRRRRDLVRLGTRHPPRALGRAAGRAPRVRARWSTGIRSAHDPVVDAGGRRRRRAHRRDAGPRGRRDRRLALHGGRRRRAGGQRAVLDRIGYGPAGVVAVTVPRLIGGALALAAVGARARRGRGAAASRSGCWRCRSPPVSASRGSRRPTAGCASASARR